MISPSSGMIMTQNTTTMTFRQQSGTQTFVQLQTTGFQNSASVDQTQYKFSHLRNGKVIETQTVQIANLRPSSMKDALMKSLNNQIGSTTSELQFTMTLGSSLPQNGKIQLSLPVWNPDAPQDQQLGIFPGTPICSGVQTINPSVACDLSQNQLTLSGLAAQLKGTTLSFSVKQVRNPYNGKVLSGFILSTLTSDGYKIEQSQSLGFSVSTPAKFTKITLTPDNSIAGNISAYRLSFIVDLPIDPTCRLIITAPISFNIASTLKQVSGKSAFQSTKLTISDNVVTIDGCQSYFASAQDDFNLISLQNPGKIKDSEPFKVELFSMSGTQMFLIASESNLVVQAASLQPGSFQSIKVTAVTTTISETTDIQISFKIQNPIPALNQLEIQFPTSQNFGFQDSLQCTLKSPLQNALANPSSCTIIGNKLTVKNFSSGPIAAGAIIGFGLQNMRNSFSTADAGTFTLRSFESDQGVNYLIDQTSVAGVYSSTAGSASFNTLPTSSSYITFEKSVTYTISFKALHTVPKNGRVKVTLPTSSVTIDNVQAIIQGSRASLGGLNNSKLVTMISCIQSSGEVVLGGIFDTDFIPDRLTGTTIWLQIPGLINPRSTQPSPSISVETQDQNGFPIDRLSDGLLIQMKTPGKLTQLTIVPQSSVNAAISSYSITVASNGPMQNGDHLKLQFPQEIVLPGSLTCTPGSNLKSVTCVRNGSAVDFALQFQNGGIKSPQNFTVNLSNIQNPLSTKMTSPFTNITSYDSQQYALSIFDQTPVTISTTLPAQIFQSSIGSSTIVPNSNVTYTLIFNTVTTIPENAAIVVQYPSSLAIQSPMNVCLMTVSGSTYKRTCTLDKGSRTIKITKGLTTGVLGGSQISLILGSFVSPQNTEDQSMIVTTYADPDGLYMVDQALQNMIPGVQCKSPCKGCASDLMPSQCTQCYTDGGKYPFLYVNRGFSTCMSNCPDGNFADYAYQCQQCYSSCLTCQKFPECSSCNRQSGYPFFYKNSCLSKCPAGTYGDSDGLCVECISPCLTCSGSQNGQCNSCSQTAGLNYLQGNTCVNNCQDGTVPLDRVCKPCTDGCATCSTSQTQCLSCLSGLFKLGTACVSQCTDGYFNDELSGQCLGCDPKCKVCQGNDPKSMVCSECNFGFNLFNGTCLISCPEGTLVNKQTSHCEVIPKSTIFDEYLMCSDVGQNMNSQMVLYFPITITLLIVIGLSIGSFYFYKQTQIYELIIAMVSPLEIISLFETCRQAFLVEGGSGFQCISDAKTEQLRTIYPVISYVTLGVLLIGYALNVYSLLSFLRNVKLNQDADFVTWRDHNKKSSYYLVLAVQTAFSFKFCWLWVSSFLNQKRYNANLGDGSSRKIYNKQMTHLGIAYMVCVNAPIFVIAVSGLVTYRWGSQIVISLIDNLIVTLSMIGVQVYLLVILSKKQYDTTMHKTAVLLGEQISDQDTKREEDELSEMSNNVEIIVGENGEKYIKGEDGEQIFISENGVRFIIEESGERVEFGVGGEKIYTEADGQKIMKAADGTKIYISDDGKLLMLNENGIKVEIEKDDPLLKSIPKDKNARLMVPQRSIDDMIEELDYDESKIGEDVDNQFGTADNSPPSMTFGYYDFNAHDVIGNVEYKGFEQGSRIDRNGLKINKGGFLIDTIGNIIDRDHSKVLDKFYSRQTQESFPFMYNFQGVKFNIKDICGCLIRDETNGRAVLKQHIETKQCWDRQARMVNLRGYLIDMHGNVINKQGRPIFEACHLSEEGEIPKIFKFTKFDRSLILGKFQCKSNGKPRLKKDKSLSVTFKRDDNGKIVNDLGYLCDLKGNILDSSGTKIFDRSILQFNTEIPAFFLQEGRLIKTENIILQSPVNSTITLLRQESIVEEVEEEEKTDQTTSILNSSQNTVTRFIDVDSEEQQPSKFKKLNLAFDKVEEESCSEDSVTTEEVQEEPKNLFLEKLRALNHGHAFGYIGEAMVSSQKYTEIPNPRVLSIMQQMKAYFNTKILYGIQKIRKDSSESGSTFRLSPNKRDNRTEPGSKMEIINLSEASPSNKKGSRTMKVSPKPNLPKLRVIVDKIKQQTAQQSPKFSTEPSVLEVRKPDQKQPELGVKDSLATFGSFENLEQAILPKFNEPHLGSQKTSIKQGEVVLSDDGKQRDTEFSSVRHKERQSPRTVHADRKQKNAIVRKDTNLTEKQEIRTNFSNSPTKPGTVQQKARKNQSKIMTADQQINTVDVENHEKTSEESDGSLEKSKMSKSPKKVFKKVNEKRLKRLEGQYCTTTVQPKPKKVRNIATAAAKTIDDKIFSDASRKQAEQLLGTNYWNQEIAWVARDLDEVLSRNNVMSPNKNSTLSDHSDNQHDGRKGVDSVMFTSYQKD